MAGNRWACLSGKPNFNSEAMDAIFLPGTGQRSSLYDGENNHDSSVHLLRDFSIVRLLQILSHVFFTIIP